MFFRKLLIFVGRQKGWVKKRAKSFTRSATPPSALSFPGGESTTFIEYFFTPDLGTSWITAARVFLRQSLIGVIRVIVKPGD